MWWGGTDPLAPGPDQLEIKDKELKDDMHSGRVIILARATLNMGYL